MTKVFFYELKRLITSRLFIAMLAVNAVFAWYILITEIIEGIAFTAPFSVWSCCVYIGKTLPLSIITILLLQAGYYGKRQKYAEILIFATPMTYIQSVLIRTAVLGVCFLMICLVESVLGAIFFAMFFSYYDFGVFVIPILLEIVPCFVFVTGIGHLAGRIHQGLIYVLLPIVFIVGFMGIAGAFDLFGGGFFSAYPLTLPVNVDGEPDFTISFVWLFARFVYLFLGMGLLFVNFISCPKVWRA